VKSAAPQTLAVKRAQVEFHNFASLGEPERVAAAYAAENARRAGLLLKHREFIGRLTPFLEIGANAGHTSYLLANEFGAQGYALDISADALRHGIALMERFGWSRAPVRVAGDALSLPFRDGSLRLVLAFQMLSQFMDVEQVFLEVKRVLAPGGVFLFAEEPLRRVLTLRLYRCPYYDHMKPWERKLYDWGLLGFLARDVIGALQEESFGIRQNHAMGLRDWHRLVARHFSDQRYEIFVAEHGWIDAALARLAVRLDPHRSVWRAARLLGGTLAAVCRKAGAAPPAGGPLDSCLRCPDCAAGLNHQDCALACPACGYRAVDEGGVYNLLPSAERSELYPGDRDDIIDFSRPGHERGLGAGWHDVEGVYGNKYRWMGRRAAARLGRVSAGPQRLRIRGYAPGTAFQRRAPVRLSVSVNGDHVGQMKLSRPGLFVFEADVPDADRYDVEILAAPVWQAPGDRRDLTVNLSMIRLVPRE
jgi:SAM-dependent methyltransferase